MKPLRIIINGDDLGLSPSIDESVLALARRGLMTSATLLVRRDPARLPALAERIREQGSPAIGLHLDLDPWFRFDETGLYGGNEEEIAEGWQDVLAANRDEIRRDVAEQVDAFRSLGLEPSHFDGHHHVHLFPGLREVVLPVMAGKGIRRARFDRDFYLTPGALDEALEAFRVNGILHPDAFFDLGALTPGTLEEAEGTVEIMAHTDLPGPDADGWRAEHYGILESFVVPAGAERISYAGLGAPETQA